MIVVFWLGDVVYEKWFKIVANVVFLFFELVVIGFLSLF